jgi:hypothetical protein
MTRPLIFVRIFVPWHRMVTSFQPSRFHFHAPGPARVDLPILERRKDPTLVTAGLVVDQPGSPAARRVKIDLRAIEPVRRVIVAGTDLNAGIARRVGKGPHLEAQFEIVVFPVGHQPYVIVVGAIHRVAHDGAVLNRPEGLVPVGFDALTLQPDSVLPSNRFVQPPVISASRLKKLRLRSELICQFTGTLWNPSSKPSSVCRKSK